MEEIERTGLGLREKIEEGQIKRDKLTNEHQNKREQIEKDRLQKRGYLLVVWKCHERNPSSQSRC